MMEPATLGLLIELFRTKMHHADRANKKNHADKGALRYYAERDAWKEALRLLLLAAGKAEYEQRKLQAVATEGQGDAGQNLSLKGIVSDD